MQVCASKVGRLDTIYANTEKGGVGKYTRFYNITGSMKESGRGCTWERPEGPGH